MLLIIRAFSICKHSLTPHCAIRNAGFIISISCSISYMTKYNQMKFIFKIKNNNREEFSIAIIYIQATEKSTVLPNPHYSVDAVHPACHLNVLIVRYPHVPKEEYLRDTCIYKICGVFLETWTCDQSGRNIYNVLFSTTIYRAHNNIKRVWHSAMMHNGNIT